VTPKSGAPQGMSNEDLRVVIEGNEVQSDRTSPQVDLDTLAAQAAKSALLHRDAVVRVRRRVDDPIPVLDLRLDFHGYKSRHPALDMRCAVLTRARGRPEANSPAD
jgi:hypothetical protein